MQPNYPFFTRLGGPVEYGVGLYKAWLSETVVLAVNSPGRYSQQAAIDWNRYRYKGDMPMFQPEAGLKYTDELVDRAEFMAAYRAAEQFLRAAEVEFLQAAPTVWATDEQKRIFISLLGERETTRAERTKGLRNIDKLTQEQMEAEISSQAGKVESRRRADFAQHAVTGEAFSTKAA